MRQVLIVANQTLGGEQLIEAVRERIAQGPCAFTLVVPVVLDSAEVITTVGGELPIFGSSYESARIQAGHRLSAGIQTLSELGAPVDGDVGAQNPVEAVGQCLAAKTYDEIIVSTLPVTVSRWLHQDVPHRVHRKFRIPVTTVTARSRVAT